MGATSADTTTEYVHGGSTSSTNTDSNLVFQLQYNMAFNDMFLMGFGGTAGAGDLKAGTIGTTDLKVKDAYSLYVAPSLAFSRNWLGYGKLAYLNGNLQNSAGQSINYDNGWGYGLGVQTLFGKHWFGQLEFMVHQHGDRTPTSGDTLHLISSMYSLTAGYNF